MINNTELKCLTTKDLSVRLQIGRSKAYALMHLPSFPSVKLGRTYIVTEDGLAKWLNLNTGKQVII